MNEPHRRWDDNQRDFEQRCARMSEETINALNQRIEAEFDTDPTTSSIADPVAWIVRAAVERAYAPDGRETMDQRVRRQTNVADILGRVGALLRVEAEEIDRYLMMVTHRGQA